MGSPSFPPSLPFLPAPCGWGVPGLAGNGPADGFGPSPSSRVDWPHSSSESSSAPDANGPIRLSSRGSRTPVTNQRRGRCPEANSTAGSTSGPRRRIRQLPTRDPPSRLAGGHRAEPLVLRSQSQRIHPLAVPRNDVGKTLHRSIRCAHRTPQRPHNQERITHKASPPQRTSILPLGMLREHRLQLRLNNHRRGRNSQHLAHPRTAITGHRYRTLQQGIVNDALHNVHAKQPLTLIIKVTDPLHPREPLVSEQKSHTGIRPEPAQFRRDLLAPTQHERRGIRQSILANTLTAAPTRIGESLKIHQLQCRRMYEENNRVGRCLNAGTFRLFLRPTHHALSLAAAVGYSPISWAQTWALDSRVAPEMKPAPS